MEFASQHIFLTDKEETEDIYNDEIEDGLGAAACDQAKLWSEAATGNNDDPALVKSANAITSEFIKEILSMPDLLKTKFPLRQMSDWKKNLQRKKLHDKLVDEKKLDLNHNQSEHVN